jgi:hypothetical protein
VASVLEHNHLEPVASSAPNPRLLDPPWVVPSVNAVATPSRERARGGSRFSTSLWIEDHDGRATVSLYAFDR